MSLKHLLASAALPASLILLSAPASAQTTIEADQDTPVLTSASGDVTINSGITVSPPTGPAVTIDSDNSVTNNGTIQVQDVDNTVGVELVGGNNGNFTNAGGIQVNEDYTPEDTDNDGVVDGPVAIGANRTGILISGTSPFVGNITLESSSTVAVEGNDSYGLRILDTAGFTGDILNEGILTIAGANSRTVSIEGDMTGNFNSSGNMSARGENASVLVTNGDITGGVVNSGTISNTGYRFTDRPPLTGRNLLGDEDLLQAGSAIQINGNISNGLFLREVITVEDNGDGTTTETLTGISNVTQFGTAAAVMIDGNGTPIALGLVAAITDPNDENFDAEQQFAFVNQGTIVASGVYDDVNSTVFEVRDATLTGGMNNSGRMQAISFRSGDDETADEADATGLARVIVFGDGAIVERINNSGSILATVSEANDAIYADFNNIIAPRALQAIAIDVGANADLQRIVNSGSITAVITGRSGEAIAIRDTSGTLTYIENSGAIGALGINSDPLQNETTTYNLVALEASANTTGITINQVAAVDEDPDDDITPAAPTISGDIFLGSGADTVSIQAGTVTGDLSFGDGADTLSLSGGSTYTGVLSDSDGMLSINVAGGSTLVQTAPSVINATSVTFSDTSEFRPTLDGATGEASTLMTTGDIMFADGATISPLLRNVVNSTSTTFTILDAGGTLTLGGALDSLSGIESPFLYDVTYGIDPNDPNALIITLDLRSAAELGLDSVQAQGFNAAFEALQNNTGLANAFVNITDGTEFNAAMNQLLPEFAAASRQFVVANVDGAVGAVGTHLDNARQSTAAPGGVWIQEFAYFADRELAQLSEQYRGHGFGMTGGIDTALGPFHTVGINLGFASTEIEDVVGVDEPLDVVTFQLGGYAGYATGNLGIEAYAGGGYNDFEATRNIVVGDFSDTSQADWSGTHYNASLRGGYDIAMSDKFWIRPTLSADYLRLNEKGYDEQGAAGIALSVADRTSEVGGVTGMLKFGANYSGRRTWIRPSVRVGYRHEFINDGITTNYGFVGLTERATLIGTEFPDSGILVGFSLAAGSNYSSFGFDFDSDIRDGFVRHTGRLVLRLIF